MAAGNVEVTRARVRRSGFVSVAHLAIAQEMQLLASAAFFGGLAMNSAVWSTGTTALLAFAVPVYVLAGVLFSWSVFRSVTETRARKSFIAGGKVQQPLVESGPVPLWPSTRSWALGVFSLDMFAMGLVFFNAAYTAPKVTGGSLTVFGWWLVLGWVRRLIRGVSVGRGTGHARARPMVPSTAGTLKKRGVVGWSLAATGMYAVAFLLLQLTVGHTLARDATARAATTTTSPAATTTSAPEATTTTPGAARTAPVSPDLQACETVMDDSLAGVADGQSTRQVVESFGTTAKATMNNPEVAVSDFQAAAVQYAAWIKSFGPAAALVAIESYVATGCPSLVSEGFTPRS